MNQIPSIIIAIPNDKDKKWDLFQKYHELFSVLLEKGVFSQKNASVTLHFDKNGILQLIQRADYLYHRKHENNGLDIQNS